jgi:hypothetical protein
MQQHTHCAALCAGGPVRGRETTAPCWTCEQTSTGLRSRVACANAQLAARPMRNHRKDRSQECSVVSWGHAGNGEWTRARRTHRWDANVIESNRDLNACGGGGGGGGGGAGGGGGR